MQGRPQDYMDVGIVHFMAFPEVMKGEGPVVAFEVKPFGEQSSEEVIAQSKAVLDAAWAAL